MATRIESERMSAAGGGDARLPGYIQILRELGSGARELAHNEVALVRAELESELKATTRHLRQIAIFGGLVALSVLPFLTFLVIGLGMLLDGRYWLSSLIVAVVFAAVGGPLAYRAFKEMKERDLRFPRVRESIKESARNLKDEVKGIKDAVKGDFDGSERIH